MASLPTKVSKEHSAPTAICCSQRFLDGTLMRREIVFSLLGLTASGEGYVHSIVTSFECAGKLFQLRDSN